MVEFIIIEIIGLFFIIGSSAMLANRVYWLVKKYQEEKEFDFSILLTAIAIFFITLKITLESVI